MPVCLSLRIPHNLIHFIFQSTNANIQVRHRERDDFDREVRSSEQHWAIELAALAQHNAKLETENIRLKDAVQQMTVTILHTHIRTSMYI